MNVVRVATENGGIHGKDSHHTLYGNGPRGSACCSVWRSTGCIRASGRTGACRVGSPCRAGTARSRGRTGQVGDGARDQGRSYHQGLVGKVDDKEVTLYTLTNANGLTMKVSNYGAIITELLCRTRPASRSTSCSATTTSKTISKNNPYFGAIVGRVANRIKDAKFKLEGKTYKLGEQRQELASWRQKGLGQGGLGGRDQETQTAVDQADL